MNSSQFHTQGQSKSRRAATGGNARFRRSVLAAACFLAVSGGVQAQSTTTYTYTFATNAQSKTPTGFMVTKQAQQTNTGNLNAILLNNLFIIDTAGDGSLLLTKNLALATAGGNTATKTSTLNLLSGGGTVSLIGQVQGVTAASRTVTSTINNPLLDTGVFNSGAVPPAITVSSNESTASSFGNDATSSLTGVVPAGGFSNSVDGRAASSYTGAGNLSTSTAGGATLSTNQVTTNSGYRAGSFAEVLDHSITLSIDDAGANITTAATVKNNAISAEFAGNRASSTFSADAGSGTYAAAVVVNSSQVNMENTGASNLGFTSEVVDSAITADLTDRAGGTNTAVAGALTVKGNSLLSTSTGNVSGNTVAFASTDVTGTGSPTLTNITAATSTTIDSAAAFATGADLVIRNSQINLNTRLLADLTDSSVTATTNGVTSAGTVTLNANTVGAQAIGNQTSNATTVADATVFSAAAATTNTQVNTGAVNRFIGAVTNNGSITSSTGFDGTNLSGAVTVNNNEVSSLAAGNTANNQTSIDATSLTSPIGTFGVSTAGDVVAPSSVATAGVTLNNLQASTGNNDPSGNIRARVVDSEIMLSAADATAAGVLVNLSAATLTENNNTLAATAVSNSASNGVTLTGTDVTATAGVANSQSSSASVLGQLKDSNIVIRALGTDPADTGSIVTLSKNTLSASATGNSASNSITVDATALTTPATLLATQAGAVTPATGLVVSSAAFSLGSSQVNTGSTVASAIADNFVQAQVGDTTSQVVNADITVNSNVATSHSTGNEVFNTLALTVDNSIAAGGSSKIANITSYQSNLSGATANSATTGPTSATQPVIGIAYAGALSGSELTVNKNELSAIATGNSAANELAVTGDSFSATAGATGTITTGATVSVQSPFSVLSRQDDNTGGVARTALLQNSSIGIDDVTSPPTVDGSSLTVNKNTLLAAAQSNTATNRIDLTGFSSFTGGATAFNQQQSLTSPLTATVDNARVRIQATNSDITDTAITLSGNSITGQAVGNTGVTIVNVDSGNTIVGNAVLASSKTTVDTAGGAASVSSSADFNAVNWQTQTAGAVMANVQANVRINLNNSDVTGGSVTLSNNSIGAIALDNSAVTGVLLNAPNVTTTASAGNYQTATGAAVASLTTQSAQAASAMIWAATATDTPLTVSGNTVTAAAGQNEAVTVLDVNATTIAGRGFATTLAAYAGGVATSTGDFSVLNVQNGSGGATATAVPGQIGIRIDSITGGSASVINNTVGTQAIVNNATNQLNLTATSGISATGSVVNVQTAAGTVGATTGDTVNLVPVMTVIGINGDAVPTTVDLSGAPATISGNTLQAIGGGNTALNSINLTAGSTIGAATGTTFMILNDQTSSANVTSRVANANIGLISPTGSVTNSAVTVNNNSVLASAYGNRATNSIVTTSLPGGGTLASYSINSTQSNTGNLAASISGVTVGITSGSVTGLTGTVGSNVISASAIGNSSTSNITSK
jgi:hypothetical protein